MDSPTGTNIEDEGKKSWATEQEQKIYCPAFCSFVIGRELETVQHLWYCVAIKNMGTEWAYTLTNNKY